MIALTQAQGIILAIGGAVLAGVALVVLLARGRRRAAAAAPDVPRAMRPGPSDPDLETPVLLKMQGWGLVLVVFFVIWVPATWLVEPDANLDQERALLTQSIARGEHGVEEFTEENQAGVGCVRCHGPTLEGARILDTATGNPIITPNLRTVCGGPFTGHPLIYGQSDIYVTIEQGRGLMPSWSVRYFGALNDQQINDIVNYIISIQDEETVTKDQNVCTNPEAVTAAVEEYLDGNLANKRSPTTNVEL